MKEKNIAYDKCIAVINSCENHQQLEKSFNMIIYFNLIYKDVVLTKRLKVNYLQKYDDLVT